MSIQEICKLANKIGNMTVYEWTRLSVMQSANQKLPQRRNEHDRPTTERCGDGR